MNVLCLGSEVDRRRARGRPRARLPRRALRRRRALRGAAEESCSDGEGDEAWPSHDCTSSPSRASVGLDRLALARDARDGRARPDDEGGRRRRRHLEPDDLPEGDLARATGTTSSSTSCSKTEDDPTEIFLQLAMQDVQPTPATCCAPVWERDGRPSTATSRSRSTRRSPTTARRRSSRRSACTSEVDKPNLFVKIPATMPGLAAIEDCIAKGKIDQRDADLLARALRGGRRGVHPRARAARRRRAATRRRSHSVASFFVSRVDTEADRRLDEIGGQATRLQGKLAIANAKLAYRALAGGVRRPALGVPRRQGRDAAALPLGVDVDEEPGVPRRDVRRGADRARDREHDAGGDDRRLPGSRRGARRHRRSRASPRRDKLLERARARSGVDYDDVVADARGARACRSSPTRSRSCSTGSAPSGASSPRA